ncbi:MAG: dTMP kinase [Patescibacteria group bacterium]
MERNKYPGKFIVFEGLDGSGQSTQAKLLQSLVKNWPANVVLTKEPTPDSDAGKLIKEILRGKQKMSPRKFQKLFARDREIHLAEVIIPHLQHGDVVISDRYFLSSLAFGATDGVDLNFLIDLNENKLNPELIKPDLMFFLDVRPEIAISRIEARNKGKEHFEKLEKLTTALSHYKCLIRDRYNETHVVDGEKSIPDISKEIQHIVADMLK